MRYEQQTKQCEELYTALHDALTQWVKSHADGKISMSAILSAGSILLITCVRLCQSEGVKLRREDVFDALEIMWDLPIYRSDRMNPPKGLVH